MANTLVIGDLHSPFIKKGYLQHCVKVSKKYNCKKIRCTGDILDNHAQSFHTTDPDGYGAKEEFGKAIKALKPWYKSFPLMNICIGNHDAIPKRKAFEGGLSSVWVKTMEDIFHEQGFTGWKFAESWEENDILYLHGLGGKAKQRMIKEGCSVVQGHYHTESHITFHVTAKERWFAMQVGCGIDNKAYSMAYAKHHPKPIISCGVILDDYTPIIETMRM